MLLDMIELPAVSLVLGAVLSMLFAPSIEDKLGRDTGRKVLAVIGVFAYSATWFMTMYLIGPKLWEDRWTPLPLWWGVGYVVVATLVTVGAFMWSTKSYSSSDSEEEMRKFHQDAWGDVAGGERDEW